MAKDRRIPPGLRHRHDHRLEAVGVREDAHLLHGLLPLEARILTGAGMFRSRGPAARQPPLTFCTRPRTLGRECWPALECFVRGAPLLRSPRSPIWGGSKERYHSAELATARATSRARWQSSTANTKGENYESTHFRCRRCFLAAAPVSSQTNEELLNDGRNTDNVLTYGMGYSQHRYSPLRRSTSAR